MGRGGWGVWGTLKGEEGKNLLTSCSLVWQHDAVLYCTGFS